MPGSRVLGPAAACLAALAAATWPAQAQDGKPLPRHLTPAEREILADSPLGAARGGDVPGGPLWCPPEYAPTEAVMVCWEGYTSWKNVLADLGAAITTVGDADLIVVVRNSSTRSAAQASLQSAGADMQRVRFIVHRLDSIWMRDYGPRFVYEGGVRVIVDHTYNRPRYLDNAWPDVFASLEAIPSYDLPLVHGGGNFHLSGLGDAYATRLIVDENPGLSEPEIVGHWAAFQGVATELVPPFRQAIDSTQHIDMWMIPVADREVIVSDWPLAPGSYEDTICDAFALDMSAQGYTVHRVPAVHTGGTHYTFTNAVICNDLVCVPSYTNSVAAQYNGAALAAWQAAMPGKTVVQIPSQAIVTASGVLHCVVMHVPAAYGGSEPTIYVRSLNQGGSLQPGEQVELEWISDDDIDTYYVKLKLSLDGGQTFPVIIDDFVHDTGRFVWTVPDVFTTQARVKAVVYDYVEGIGEDVNDADFTINGSGGCIADFDGSGTVDTQDVLAFLNAWANGDPWADINGDGQVNTQDVTAFLNAWAGGC